MSTQEEFLEDNPELQEAMRNMETGEYDHTLFEIWLDAIDNLIVGANEEPTIQLAHSIISTWPWLQYPEIQEYLDFRQSGLEEIRHELVSSFPKDQDELFLENKDDWDLHKDAYLEVIARWTALANRWSEAWKQMPWDSPEKRISHGAFVDLTNVIAGPNSLPEHLKNLKNFETTKEDGEKVSERVAELLAE